MSYKKISYQGLIQNLKIRIYKSFIYLYDIQLFLFYPMTEISSQTILNILIMYYVWDALDIPYRELSCTIWKDIRFFG